VVPQPADVAAAAAAAVVAAVVAVVVAVAVAAEVQAEEDNCVQCHGRGLDYSLAVVAVEDAVRIVVELPSRSLKVEEVSRYRLGCSQALEAAVEDSCHGN
jgi:hypothetical protein